MNYSKYEMERELFSSFYAENTDKFEKTSSIIRSLIANILPLSISSSCIVTSRVKTLESCLEKAERKYEERIEAGEKLTELITDIIGIRVVCLYSDEINLIVNAIKSELSTGEITDKIAKIEEAESLFGYRAYHAQIKLGESRRLLPEYAVCDGISIEMQVRTVVQDAWSVVDHKIRYKKEIPIQLKRRVARIAAIFELADEEFLSIRNLSDNLEKVAESGEQDSILIVGETIDKKAIKQSVTVFDLLSQIRKDAPELPIPGYQVEQVLSSIRDRVKVISVDELPAMGHMLSKAQSINAIISDKLKFSTDYRIVIRIAFWLSDRDKFSDILSNELKSGIFNIETKNET